MNFSIIAIGRAKAGPERELFRHYAARIQWPLELIELEEKRKLPPAQTMAAENALLIGAIPKDFTVVALDRRGKPLDSAGLAAHIAQQRDSGRAGIAFLIGGADGLSEATLKRATLVLSFGALTWPHMLARAMLAEQLYRAQQIIAGHPYHRG